MARRRAWCGVVTQPGAPAPIGSSARRYRATATTASKRSSPLMQNGGPRSAKRVKHQANEYRSAGCMIEHRISGVNAARPRCPAHRYRAPGRRAPGDLPASAGSAIRARVGEVPRVGAVETHEPSARSANGALASAERVRSCAIGRMLMLTAVKPCRRRRRSHSAPLGHAHPGEGRPEGVGQQERRHPWQSGVQHLPDHALS